MIETPKEVTVLKAQMSKLETKANSITITNAEEQTDAIDLVSKLKETGSKIKESKESITKPLNEALKNARNLFAPLEEQFKNAETIIKAKLLAYAQKVNAEAQAKEQKIADRVEKGTLKLDTAEKKLDQIERVDNTTHGNVGSVSIKKIKKVRYGNLVDLSSKLGDGAKENLIDLIKDGYLIWDETKVRKDALGGKTIYGIEIYEEEILAAK